MGVTCSCVEERIRVSKVGLQTLKKSPSQAEPDELVFEEEFSMYGSIGKYQIDKQTGKWKSKSKDVFLGHMTEGKVFVDKDQTKVLQLADFNARICVRFKMPDSLLKLKGGITLVVDCFTTKSLHSADIFLNGEKIASRIEV